MRTRNAAVVVVLLVAALNLAAWILLNLPQSEAPWYGSIRGVSFSPYQLDQSPHEGKYPDAAEIERDLALVADKVRSIRTYDPLDGLDVIPALARKYGLKVTQGVWLDKRKERNAQGLAKLYEMIQKNDNINRVIVGNEAILRGDLTVDELIPILQEVRSRTHLPVSTAEPWHVWLKYPQLVDAVDFIAVQLLPYWEKTTIDEALDYVLRRYRELQQHYPDKPILVSEVGWPSGGGRFGGAEASLTNQARFIRQFLYAAQNQSIDYYVMEAFDQPWKKVDEGSPGPYWGLFNGERQQKFSLTKTEIIEDAHWPWQAGLSTLLALPLMLWFALRFPELKLRGQLFYAALTQAGISLVVSTAFVPSKVYLSVFGISMLSVMLAAQLALLAVVLINGFEFTEILWKRDWKRAFRPLDPNRDRPWPKVSLHLACYNEPPELVIETLNSLARLDYPDFEVLVIDNNTKDPAVWKPLEEHCAKLGPRFRFFHVDPLSGYKAGALNYALRHTHPEARIIGVVDADYVVEPNWLISLVPYFDDPKVGFVQAPQDHRAWEGDTFKEMINWEYAGFFNIGMVHRNERDAIIQHGTMTLIRKEAMQKAGNWGEWCICEDTELGLRLMAEGFESVYVNHVFGRGVTPDSFAAYKTQRFRWAFGAVQILRRYWNWMLPFARSPLTGAQRFHFVTGWLPWFADGLHLLFTFGALIWSIGLVLWPRYFDFPMPVFLISVLVMFLLKITHSFVLYHARVPCNLRQRIGAAVAAVALTHVIGRAMLSGLFSRGGRPFLRTPKGENQPALIQGLLMAREEGFIMLALWLAALAVSVRYDMALQEARYWVLLLLVQSLPYVCAVVLSLIAALPSKHGGEAANAAPA
ncbi:MAG TPA: glycosyltransferase [Candidatus Competibacteraceae bacterium]|nr:glycosyltransferase [Candidatus Competibacteraceae bacterium]